MVVKLILIFLELICWLFKCSQDQWGDITRVMARTTPRTLVLAGIGSRIIIEVCIWPSLTFDTVNRNQVWKILEERKVPSNLMRATESVYRVWKGGLGQMVVKRWHLSGLGVGITQQAKSITIYTLDEWNNQREKRYCSSKNLKSLIGYWNCSR